MKKIIFIASLFAVTGIFLNFGCGKKPEGKLTLMLDWFPNPDHAPIYVAIDKGFFKEKGIDLELQVPANPDDPLKLVAARKVDLAVTYEPQIIIARSRDLPTTSVGLLVSHPLSAIMYLSESGIKSAKDLKGKKIGYSISGFEEALIHAVTSHAGLSPNDYEKVNVNFNIVPSLLSKKVDAVAGAYRNYEKIQMELQGKKVGLILPEENGVPDYYELVIVANMRTIKLKRKLIKSFGEALEKGILYTTDHPQEAFEIFTKANPDLNNELNRKALFATLPYFARSQVQDSTIWGNFQDFLLKEGVIDKKSDVNLLFKNL